MSDVVADPARPPAAERCRPVRSGTEEHEAVGVPNRPAGSSICEIMPYVDQWDEAESSRKAASQGVRGWLLQLGFPERMVAFRLTRFFGIIKAEEMARHGSGG